MTNKKLPNLGTPETCFSKMTQGYRRFIQSAAMFITLCEFYSDKKNEGKKLPSNFTSMHSATVNKLNNDSSQDIFDSIALYSALTLSFVREIKENLDEYFNLIKDGQDEHLTDYEKCCDLLTITDEFTDLKTNLDHVSATIINQKCVKNHINDPKYDPNSIECF